MRKRWLLALIFPLTLSLGACLDPTGSPMPPDDEKTGEDKPDTNAAIVLVQEVA